jgi:two-component system cell cycle sensor histidine kinase/response regulator CckA
MGLDSTFRPRTVLVVDDDAVVRRVAYGHLSDSGFRVFEAEDGQEALEVLARAGALDLVIVDVVMPRMDGPAFIARLLEARPGQAVLCISAYPADVLTEGPGAIPAVPFLAKPFTRQELLAKVQEALEAVRLRTAPAPPAYPETS